MGNEAEETAAINALDGAGWMGRDIKVNKANPIERNNRSDNRGGYGNRGGQR